MILRHILPFFIFKVDLEFSDHPFQWPSITSQKRRWEWMTSTIWWRSKNSAYSANLFSVSVSSWRKKKGKLWWRQGGGWDQKNTWSPYQTDLKTLTFWPPDQDLFSPWLWNMQMIAVSTTNIRSSESYCFHPLINVICIVQPNVKYLYS